MDLAGTEKMETSDLVEETHLEETKSINKNSFFFNQFVSDYIKQKENCLSYRNSELTKILKDSFMLDQNVVFLICLNPSQNHLEKSLINLDFAEQVKKLKERQEQSV